MLIQVLTKRSEYPKRTGAIVLNCSPLSSDPWNTWTLNDNGWKARIWYL
jgi:hypothetical protein